ncbi:hypothetical protein Bca52824_043072 [Brassica carinata]|uniref:Uncharacterized protein n=1 Tax=Brassica carinata TaxID=52824 RepID=A0A8X7RZI4_BRACI|nr:hypothetical protein Bca52824_043072 [Brassica carinata]
MLFWRFASLESRLSSIQFLRSAATIAVSRAVTPRRNTEPLSTTVDLQWHLVLATSSRFQTESLRRMVRCLCLLRCFNHQSRPTHQTKLPRRRRLARNVSPPPWVFFIPVLSYIAIGNCSATTNSAADYHVCLGPESRAPTSSSSSQARLVVMSQQHRTRPLQLRLSSPSWLSFRSRSSTAPPSPTLCSTTESLVQAISAPSSLSWSSNRASPSAPNRRE